MRNDLERTGRVTYIGPRALAVAVCLICGGFTALSFGLDRFIGVFETTSSTQSPATPVLPASAVASPIAAAFPTSIESAPTASSLSVARPAASRSAVVGPRSARLPSALHVMPAHPGAIAKSPERKMPVARTTPPGHATAALHYAPPILVSPRVTPVARPTPVAHESLAGVTSIAHAAPFPRATSLAKLAPLARATPLRRALPSAVLISPSLRKRKPFTSPRSGKPATPPVPPPVKVPGAAPHQEQPAILFVQPAILVPFKPAPANSQNALAPRAADRGALVVPPGAP